MINELLCRSGRHDVERCAGRGDHRWTWADDRWQAKVEPVTPGGEEPVTVDPDPAPGDDPVTVDPEPVTGCVGCTLANVGLHRAECPIRRRRHLTLRSVDLRVLAGRPPAGKNNLDGRGAHRSGS